MTLSIERRGAIAILRYDHPPRNFLALAVIRELRRAWRALERDPEVRVIVLAGARTGHFMLHVQADELAAMLGSVPRAPRAVRVLVAAVLRGLSRWPWLLDRLLIGGPAQTAAVEVAMLQRAIERSAKATLAVIDGPCVGGGLELALCFDQRIAADADEVRFGLPETTIGIIPGFGGTQRLARLIGAAPALGLMLEGELVSSRRAHELGLVGLVVRRDELWGRAFEIAERIAARPPRAVAALKRAVREGVTRSLERGLSVELVEVAGLAADPRTRAAIAAYAERLERTLALPEVEQPTIIELAETIERELRVG